MNKFDQQTTVAGTPAFGGSRIRRVRRPKAAPRRGGGPGFDRLCRALREQVDAATDAQANLLSTLSHDLRNPLSVILASTRLLARAIDTDSPIRRHVDAAARCSDEMNQILSDASDAAHAVHGDLTLNVEPADPASMVAMALEAVRPLCQTRTISVSTEIGSGVGSVDCDVGRIVRVLTVLLSNAARFTHKGGQIGVSVAREAGHTSFAVADAGAGIPPEQLADVFSAPFGVPSRRSAGSSANRAARVGSGLALAVAYASVTAHGGRMWVESTVSRGSTFRFTLPDSPGV